MVFTGANSYVKYGWESTFGTKSSSLTKVFGLQQKVSNWSLTNNRKVLGTLNQVEPQSFAYGQQTGTLSVDFVLSNPWIFRALYGAPSSVTTGSPEVHTFPHATSGQQKTIEPFSVEVGVELGATDQVRSPLGCVLNSLTIRTSVDDLVNCTADISYGKEGDATTTLDSSPPTDDVDFPFTFAHGALTWGGATVAEIQSADISFTQNASLLYTLNSHQATGAYRQLFEITGNFQSSMLNSTKFAQLLDQIEKPNTAEVASGLVLTFTNGGTGSNEKSITITGTGLSIGTHSVSGIEPVNPIFEDISWQIRSATVVARNNISTAL